MTVFDKCTDEPKAFVFTLFIGTGQIPNISDVKQKILEGHHIDEEIKSYLNSEQKDTLQMNLAKNQRLLSIELLYSDC